jgi:hypothetical protein
MDEYKYKRKDLKKRKREAMEEDLTSDERKQISNVFKRESRSLKRSEKQAVAKAIRDLGLF